MNENKCETLPFLGAQKPVTLNPSWESQKLSNYDNQFTGSKMAKYTNALKPPRDKYMLVFLIFVLHGLGTLMPWNMFITAKNYFVYFKLGSNSTGESDGLESTYAKNFLQYIGFAAQLPNLLFNWLNIFVNMGGDLTKRIVYSILIEIIIFIITIVLAMLDSSDWPGLFFWITIISVVILNMANGVYQNTIYGMAATFPTKYTGGVVLGSNVSGLFASLLSIFSKFIFSSIRTSAIYYFITAVLTLLVCFDTYFALPLNKFFRHYQSLRQTDSNESKIKVQEQKTPYWSIVRQASPQLFNIFFTFFVTLSIFPAIQSDIKPISEEFIIPKLYFSDITCFLTFNLFAMLGSLTTSWIQWPKPKFLIAPVLLRAVFIPLFLLSNYQPLNTIRTLPVLISNDWLYWIIAMAMSFGSGYLSSLGMMYAPQVVNPKYQITAGMFAAAMLITGIFSGVTFSIIFPKLI